MDIEAEIYFLTAKEGGRTLPVFSGYRPQFHYDVCDFDATQYYVGVAEPVALGQTVTTRLTFMNPQLQLGKLHPGKEFLVREGLTVVGRGRVTQLLNLENSAKERLAMEARRRGTSSGAP